MSEIPATLAAQHFVMKQNAVMGMVRQQADADKAMANILEQAARSVAPSSQGTRVDIRA